MSGKRLIVGLSVVIFIISVIGYVLIPDGEEISNKIKEEEKKEVSSVPRKTNQSKPKVVEKKYDLYSATPYDLPLFSITEISKLPDSIKKTVDNLLEASQGFYYLKESDGNVFVIFQTPVDIGNTYSRHDLQFAEISPDGKIVYHSAGYNGTEGETANAIEQKVDKWEFDKNIEPLRPIKHISYDEKGKIKYSEVWNYSSEEPIKYEMKDSYNNTISILKESQDNDLNFRKEHIFYDNNGNIVMSLTINYDEANISRVIFHNSHEKVDGFSILSEYTDGLKTKELIYNQEYELINTVISEYVDGTRKSITVYDSEGKEVKKISS